MKKIIYILLTITFLSTNFYSFFTKNNEQAIHFLYQDRDVVHIYMEEEAMRDMEIRDSLIQSLIDFSFDHQVNITQLTFFNSQDMNFYATNPSVDNHIQLLAGEYPKENFHIANRGMEIDAQIGEMFFPLSQWSIRVYDFNQVRNVGINGTLHISGATEQVLGAFHETFSAYGEVSFLDRFEDIEWFLGTAWEEERVADNHLLEVLQMDSPLFMVVIFSFLLLFVGICFFIHTYKKQILLEDLWGYPVGTILLGTLKKFLPFFLGLITAGALATILLSYALSQQTLLADYLGQLGMNSIVIAIFFFFFLTLATVIVRKLNEAAVGVRGRGFFQSMNQASLVGKGLIYVGLIVIGLTVFQNLQHLQQELEGMSFWGRAENIFTVTLFYPDTLSEEDAFFFDEEVGEYLPTNEWLLLERKRSDLDTALYRLLSDEKQAFVMESQWMFSTRDPEWDNGLSDEALHTFERFRHLVPSSDYERGIPFYFTPGLIQEEVDLFFYRTVMISPNYLELNPIYQADGENAFDGLIKEDNTLNILVSEAGKAFEEEIYTYFRDFWFYLHKVRIYNITNEAVGLPLMETTAEDLTVNIIWTKEEQQFFTFNSQTGDNQNQITDPVAIVYTGNLDTDFIRTKMMNGVLFFMDESRGAAMIGIEQAMEEVGITATPVISSVFNEANEELIHTQWVVFQQSVLLTIIIIFAVVLIVVYVWSYYSANAYEINLKYLFGYNLWERNKFIVISAVIVNIASGILAFFLMDTVYALLAMSMLIMVDAAIIYLLGNHFTKTSVVKIMKGAD